MRLIRRAVVDQVDEVPNLRPRFPYQNLTPTSQEDLRRLMIERSNRLYMRRSDVERPAVVSAGEGQEAHAARIA